MEGRLEAADPAYLRDRVTESWKFPIVSVTRTYDGPDDLRGLVWRDDGGDIAGLVTWHTEGDWAEIVTLEAFEQGRHVGGRLMDGAEEALRREGIRRISITTTNDNVRAIAFYLRRGYRLVQIELDGMERVRDAKPALPYTGHDGLPLLDMLLFEKIIA
jgi:ribosomal protein S18 acetylase RimI-like enzyme